MNKVYGDVLVVMSTIGLVFTLVVVVAQCLSLLMPVKEVFDSLPCGTDTECCVQHKDC